ncbi:MAG: aconitase X catalytic domain-containing protein [Candidatus Bathyarchaeia archaeon]
MYLSKKQEKMLDGEDGEGVRLAMQLITRIGDMYGADRLVEISRSHVLGHFGSLHIAGVELLEKFTNLGAKFIVPTTVDPISIEPNRWKELKIEPEYAEHQLRLIKALNEMRVVPTYSCIPYLIGNVPRYKEVFAWSESSAVAYSNSIVGARTNRMTAGFDIACAITGLTPNFGFLRDENRHGQVLVEVRKKELRDLDYHTLGYIVGKAVGNMIPVITGLSRESKADQLKGLGAAAASSGSVALFHVVGISPDAGSAEEAFGPNKPEDKIVIDEEDIAKTEDEIGTSDEEPDLIAVGCPHFSVPEIIDLARLVRGKKVKSGVEFWLYTSESICNTAERMGLIPVLESAGINVLCSTCAVVCPIRNWGFNVMMTNSAKFANVVPSEHGIDIAYAPLEKIVEVSMR